MKLKVIETDILKARVTSLIYYYILHITYYIY